ncbi:MAG: IS1595 family transposase [Candidatus Korobacteraceae bacterium]|jgi:transposase-like protein
MNRRQTIPKHLRFTVEDFNRRFPNDAACLDELMRLRFPDGIAYCETCDKDRKHYRIEGRPVYSCGHCGTQVSPMAGTIFEKSTTSLRLWFYAMYLMASTRCGISAKQIQRETGVTYKTAWRMFKQIRSLLSEADMQLEGLSIEMDESYFGAKRKRGAKRGRPSPSDTTKQCVVGVVERGVGKGRVIATVANDATKATLHGIAKERILPESVVFTDEYASYNGLEGEGYEHRRINHSAGVYVLGDVHTNTIEGFWSLVKRGITGVYHNVGRNYLQTYLDEYSFRYNRRNRGNLIFNDVLQRVSECAVERPSARVRQTQPR